jgi:hypothetical protein
LWFNVVLVGSQVPGIARRSEDLGAAQMVDRLLGRMKAGDAIRQAKVRH